MYSLSLEKPTKKTSKSGLSKAETGPSARYGQWNDAQSWMQSIGD